MTTLFKRKDPADLRSVRYPILLTEKEAVTIRHSAHIRQMSVAEFIRRAALGRKAEVDYNSEAVLVLSTVTRAIRELHAGMVKFSTPIQEEALSELIVLARAAMLRIAK